MSEGCPSNYRCQVETSGSAGSSTSASVARSAANSSTTLSAGRRCGNPAESTESSSRSRTSKTRCVAAVPAATPFRNSASIGNDVVKQAVSARPQNENLEMAPGAGRWSSQVVPQAGSRIWTSGARGSTVAAMKWMRSQGWGEEDWTAWYTKWHLSWHAYLSAGSPMCLGSGLGIDSGGSIVGSSSVHRTVHSSQAVLQAGPCGGMQKTRRRADDLERPDDSD